jgi:hypothetical protein
MHGTIIHYDTLTQCGLLRTEAGQLHYFRRADVAEATGLAAGSYVALRIGTPPDTGGSRMDIAEGMAAVRTVEQARRQMAAQQAAIAPVRRSRFGWLGGGLSVVAVLCLLLAGGEATGYSSPNPRLVDSPFGVAAAGLLVWLAILFVTHKTRRAVRFAYWFTVLSSMMAYVGQLFDGFETDAAATAYGYLLIALFFAGYLVPKR